MTRIIDRLGVPQGITKAILCFGFEQSKAFHPGGRGDPTGTEILIEVLRDKFLPDYFPVVVTERKTGRYLKDRIGCGFYIFTPALAMDPCAFWKGVQGRGFSTLDLVAEIEAITARYTRYSLMTPQEWRRVIIERIGFWVEVMSAFEEVVYLNGNAPHVFDDLIAYRVAREFGHPTLCLYRLPIVPGVSSRLMIFDDIFRQDSPLCVPNGATPPGVGADDLGAMMAGFAGAAPSGVSAPPNLAADPDLGKRVLHGAKRVYRGTRWLFQRIVRKALRSDIPEALAVLRDYRRHATRAVPDRFVYYPLHMQPEASSQPLGGIYADQELLVRHLLEALPEGVKLVVKEHPQQFSSTFMIRARERGFYARMAADDRIVLLHHSVPARDLLQRCLAAVTLTGTTALEALAMGKPCFVMGASPFVRAPNALVPRDHAALCAMMRNLAEGHVAPVTTAQISAYLDWLRAHSVFGYVDPYVHTRLEGLFSQADNIAAVTTALCAAIDQVRAPRANGPPARPDPD